MIVELPVPHNAVFKARGRAAETLHGLATLPFRVAELRAPECPEAACADIGPRIWRCDGYDHRPSPRAAGASRRVSYRMHPSGGLMRPLWLTDPAVPVTAATLAGELAAFPAKWSSRWFGLQTMNPFLAEPALRRWNSDPRMAGARASGVPAEDGLPAAAARLRSALAAGAAFVDGVLHVPSLGPAFEVPLPSGSAGWASPRVE